MASQNLLSLRAKLDEQTNDIQKLQKAVEEATQSTISQLSLSYRETCRRPSPTNHTNTPSGSCAASSERVDFNVFSSVPIQSLTIKRPLCAGQTSPRESSVATKCNLMQKRLSGTSCPAETHAGTTTLKDYPSRLLSDSQRRLQQNSHSIDHKQPSVRQTVSGLDSKIQELMKEKNIEVDMRLRLSKDQEDTNLKLQVRVQELEATNVMQEERLKQAHIYTEILKEMLKEHDQVLQDIQRAIVTYHEESEKNVQDNIALDNLGTMVARIFQELADELSFHKREIHSANDQLEVLKRELEDRDSCLKEYQERCDNLANEHGQKAAVLSAEVSAARSHAETIQHQMETLQEQNAEHSKHITNLELKVFKLHSELHTSKRAHTDKVEELKKQLMEANSTLEVAQKEHTQCNQELGDELQQLHEALKMCEKQLSLEKEHSQQLRDRETVNSLTNEHLRRELIERSVEVDRLQAIVNMVKEESQQKTEQQYLSGNVIQYPVLHRSSLQLRSSRRTIQEKTSSLNFTSSQLLSMKDALQKTAGELAIKTQSLENAEKNVTESKNLLAEKDKALKSAVGELKKLHLYAEDKKRELQQLKIDSEKISEIQKDSDTLKLLLVEKDNMIITLRGQIQAITQMIGQRNQKLGALEAERSQLLEEVTVRKAEIQDVKAAAEKNTVRIFELEEMCTVLELEKANLTNSSAKKALAAKRLRKEKEELMAKLRETQSDLANLAEDYKTLKSNYQNQTGDKEHMATILKMQLKTAIAELEQTKSALKTVEDCDGHAIKIATRMQKKITAKREQIDSLQSRINFLKEALSNAIKDKQYQKVEKAKLMQECAQEAAERNTLSHLVEILKSENDTLKGKLASREAALDKALLQLSECQTVIQRLEQEAMCLRLQYTLDLKELKGPVLEDKATKQFYLTAPVSSPHSSDFPVRDYNLHIKANNIASKPTEPSVKDNIAKPTEDVIHLSDSLSSLPCKEEAAVKLRKCIDQTSGHISNETFTKDLTDSSSRTDSFSREPVTLYTADLEDQEHLLSIINTENSYLVEPCYTSSPKKRIRNQEIRPRSPVHSLLTAPACGIDIHSNMESPNNVHPAGNFALDEQYDDLNTSACQGLQYRLESLQSLANDLQVKNKESLLG
ncbi:coiled-coil domain-containing protein 158 isoform X2 [Pseudophryne corroboree]|uniref:coiled-coil domain-containing protein 158 isoform X2 n=1 Tax=Pseudophryne corroboree TaxID=495146 RepID=UPI003081ECED